VRSVQQPTYQKSGIGWMNNRNYLRKVLQCIQHVCQDIHHAPLRSSSDIKAEREHELTRPVPDSNTRSAKRITSVSQSLCSIQCVSAHKLCHIANTRSVVTSTAFAVGRAGYRHNPVSTQTQRATLHLRDMLSGFSIAKCIGNYLLSMNQPPRPSSHQ
jgi:hypothetical protein